MTDMPLIEIDRLSVAFDGEGGRKQVLSDISFALKPGEILGVVGESGSGKSVTTLAIMRLLGPQGRITAGRIVYGGKDLAALGDKAMQPIRGRDIAMIFQEPMTSLNPLMSIGAQIAESLRTHLGLDGKAARKRGIELLAEVGIPSPETRYDDPPFQLSGGMRQRVMIALAMACQPKLLIADEPTTALDVTIQAQILELMKKLRRDHGSAILLITHDMGVIARMAERIVVMYAGEIVEMAEARTLFSAPAHPYTGLLLASMPSTRHRVARLPVIPGQMPAPGEIREGCRFRARCPVAVERCASEAPALRAIDEGRGASHLARCHLAEVRA